MGSGDEKQMLLRYSGVCRICGAELPASTLAIYERVTKTVRCIEHASGTAPIDRDDETYSQPFVEGTPGASARLEYERRRGGREKRIRGKHPKIGGFLLSMSDDPQSTKAWNTGALGEERLGTRLNELASETMRVLHDRRIPKSRTNIDHIVVAPSGVWVIDAKKYRGRPRLQVEGGLLRPRVEKLMVGGRDCTKVVDGVLKQVEVVLGVLGPGVPVHGVLCFVEADWPLVGGSFATQGVEVTWPKRMYGRLERPGALDAGAISELQRRLAEVLPPA